MKTTTQIIAKEGWKCAGVVGLFMLFFLALNCDVGAFLAFVALVIALVGHYNPERIPSEGGDNILFAPIDGTVEHIETREDSCVMRLFSPFYRVGVVRAPIGCKVVGISKKEGLRLFDGERAELLNASTVVRLDSSLGAISMKFIPRVFKNNLFIYPEADSKAKECERIGFMRCGTLELVLPKNVNLKVCEGDLVRGGESVLGILGA